MFVSALDRAVNDDVLTMCGLTAEVEDAGFAVGSR